MAEIIAIVRRVLTVGGEASSGRAPLALTRRTIDGMRIDLNADVGESLGPWPMGDDAAMIPLMTSVNIACGFHAGDPPTIERTVALAIAAGAAIGAHPGYPDLTASGDGTSRCRRPISRRRSSTRSARSPRSRAPPARSSAT
jgi:hypothetical protein